MARILILIEAHLCTSPRAVKEADTLSSVGHKVSLSGGWTRESFVERDLLLARGKKWQFTPLVNYCSQSVRSRSRFYLARARARLARERYLLTGAFTPALLGYNATAMLKVALQEQADLTIVHSESGLWIGSQLLNRGMRVGVDFEDWFSEDLLPEDRRTRPTEQIKLLERRLANDCPYRLTTSHALADELSKAYNAPKPTVVYNVFPFGDRKSIDGKICDRRDLSVTSIHWFSQTIGPGRGLETLFKSLSFLSPPMEIHLRGNHSEGTKRWVQSLLPESWKGFVFMHHTVTNSELLSRIAEHDIGVGLEQTDIRNKDLTISNKIFQYMQAGLAIVATDTKGQKEALYKCPKAGVLIPSGNPLSLARAIMWLTQNRERLAEAKNASLCAAKNIFSWEAQSENLLHESERALSLNR